MTRTGAMIVVRLNEGLGNQLFQYAMGRAVALRHGVELKVDASWFDTHQGGAARASPRRPYRLDAFHVRAAKATRRELAVHRPLETPLGRLVDKALRLGAGRVARQVHERGMWFQPNKLDTGPDATLIGYWQSERYFADVADTIRSEFTLRETPDVTDARRQVEAYRHGANGPVVAVHVRRGDLVPFMLNGKLQKNYGPPTSTAYLRAAMALFPADSRFIVVSDPQDRDWCRRHVTGGDVVHHAGQTDMADFAAMQACDHNVIANSTFSWWAAWLNPNPDKRVVAPTPWFWPDSPDWRRSDDLVPQRWTSLPSGPFSDGPEGRASSAG